MRSRWHLMFRAMLFLMMFGYGLSAYASNSKVSIDVDGIALENVLKSIYNPQNETCNEAKTKCVKIKTKRATI